MQEYLKEENPGLNLGIAELVAALGFLMIIIANFLSFAPIEERTWREIGVGFPVMLVSVIGMALVLKRRYFSAFMIGMFAAFFITHEIIICYDNKAIEMGRELGANGWFRLVAMIFHDALNMSHGSFWGVAGSSISLLAILIAWPLKVYQDNKAVVSAPRQKDEEGSIDYARKEATENSEETTEFAAEDTETDEDYDEEADDGDDEIT